MRLAALLLALAACSVSPALSPRDCTPGATGACACPGASGVQTCGADGTLGACVCADAGARVDVVLVTDAPRMDVQLADRPDVPLADVVDVVDAPELPDTVDAPELDAGAVDAGEITDAECPLFVDVASDPLNCGRCGNVCPMRPNTMANCRIGSCTSVCRPGFAECDLNVANGCEADFNNDARRCGSCRTECASGQVCRNARCVNR